MRSKDHRPKDQGTHSVVTKPEGVGYRTMPIPLIESVIWRIIQYGLAGEKHTQPSKGLVWRQLGDPFGWNVIPGCLLNVAYRSSFQV